MILVTLGTNDKKFTRLLDAVEQAIHEGAITGKVVVQAGFTEYESSDMEVIAYIDQQKFAEYMNQADLIITHGGVGTIMTALREKKKFSPQRDLQNITNTSMIIRPSCWNPLSRRGI